MNATTKKRAASASATAKRRRPKTPEPVEPKATVAEDPGSRPPLSPLSTLSAEELAYRALLVECHRDGMPEDTGRVEGIVTAALRNWENLADDLAKFAEAEVAKGLTPDELRLRDRLSELLDKMFRRGGFKPYVHATQETKDGWAECSDILEFVWPKVRDCFTCFDTLCTTPKPLGWESSTPTGDQVERKRAYQCAKHALLNASALLQDLFPNGADDAKVIIKALNIPGPRTPLVEPLSPPPPPPAPRKPTPPNTRVRDPMDIECQRHWESRAAGTSTILALGQNVNTFVAWLHMRTQELEDKVQGLEKQLAEKGASGNGTA